MTYFKADVFIVFPGCPEQVELPELLHAQKGTNVLNIINLNEICKFGSNIKRFFYHVKRNNELDHSPGFVFLGQVRMGPNVDDLPKL